ncbi:MAG: sigma-70 family RNA polymerase sigma factor, partial [Planctomycetota bacterium]|nr:sigma-70 family RNA polymerase sigma factor [Planctomycetota bacterium]
MQSLEALFADMVQEVDLEAVLKLVGQELVHYARVVTGSRELAEDAVQDTLVALLKLGPRAREISEPRAWLFTVVRRCALKYRKSPPPLECSLAESVEGDPAERMMLQEAFRHLDPAAQEIAVLHLWEGLTFGEIAVVLKIPRGTALSTWHRGLKDLRARFGDEAGLSSKGPRHEQLTRTVS